MAIKKLRKIRSDKKYKYRKKQGKMLPYYSKRNKNDPIKLWIWEEMPMDADSIKRIPVGLRSTARKVKFMHRMRIDVPPERISSRKLIESLMEEVVGRSGSFYIMTFCHRKNKFRVSPVKACSVQIFETDQGIKARFGKDWRMFRYWFFKDKIK